MKATERPDIASAYIQRIRELVGGQRTMAAITYAERGDEDIHLSDVVLGSCLAIPYYRKLAVKQGLPVAEISDESALFFLRGRVIERAIASEMAPKVCEGVMFTLDDFHPVYGYAEIKSTSADMSKFDPKTMYDHWASRIKGYCYGLGIEAMNLVVMFMQGNTASHKWGRDGRQTVGLKAWSLEYTKDEIFENWSAIKRNKAELESALAEDAPIDPLMVTPQGYECASCAHKPICQYTSAK